MQIEGPGNASTHLVVVDDHTLERHAHLKDRGEVLDTVERDLRDVQQPRHATDLHERSVRLDCLDMPVTVYTRYTPGKTCTVRDDEGKCSLLVQSEDGAGVAAPHHD